jgi:hypothetical protein
MLLEASCIDGADASVDTVDTQFIGTQSDDFSISLVRRIGCAVVAALEALPEDPDAGYGGEGMRGWEFGERREEDWVDKVPVGTERDKKNEGYHRDQRDGHVGATHRVSSR